MKYNYEEISNSLTTEEYIKLIYDESLKVPPESIEETILSKQKYILDHEPELRINNEGYFGFCDEKWGWSGCGRPLLWTEFPGDTDFAYCPFCREYCIAGSVISFHYPENDKEWDHVVDMLAMISVFKIVDEKPNY